MTTITGATKIVSARPLWMASKNRSYRLRVKEILKTLATFLQDNSLLIREVLPAGVEIDENFVLRRSDFTDEGFEYYRQIEQRWLSAVDGGLSPADAGYLEKALRDFRSRRKRS